jgi:hypothetical protein
MSGFLVGSGQLLIAEGIEVRSIDQVIEFLQLHHEKIEHWKSTPPTSLELAIATTNINATINFLKNTRHREYASLKSQLDSANDQIKTMTATISLMGDKISELERKIERNAQLFMLHDLNQIFRYYIAEPKIGSWGTFVENVVTMKAKFEDNEITEDEFKNFILPFNTSLGFDVATLIEFIQDRHAIGHSDVRSAKNQQQFLLTCKTTHFDDDLKPFVDEITRQLSSPSISYHRMN